MRIFVKSLPAGRSACACASPPAATTPATSNDASFVGVIEGPDCSKMKPLMARTPPALPARHTAARLALIVAFVMVSRAAYLSPFVDANRDGPVYVNALKLDRSYDVPATPGKIGFVLAAWL